LASVLGEVGVEYFKIGSLYAELKSKDLLEEYKYVLERRILELEPTMLNKSVDKYMTDLRSQENMIELPATAIPAKLESTRRYLPAPPLMIENHFIENQKFLTNVEKMKMLDQPMLSDK